MMIEPTESEGRAELNCFSEAMIAIRKEIRGIGRGTPDRQDNPLKRAPHVTSYRTNLCTKNAPCHHL